MTITHNELRTRWAHRRDVLRECGDDKAAKMIEKFLADLGMVEVMEADEILSIPQASTVCGYSSGHLRRLVRMRKLDNFGRPNAPRVRRGDLPRKIRGLTDGSLHSILTNKAQIARSIVHPARNNDG